MSGTAAARWPVGLPTRLRPVRPIGRGGSAWVWRALDVDAGAEVAVKVLDGTGWRHEQEVRALGRLRGVEGVGGVHELGRTVEGTAWLVLDLFEGGSLLDRAPLDEFEALRVLGTTATALARVHELDLCHGDLTPTNVLFDGDRPVLVDFGLAALGTDAPPERLPAGCTPAYAAPERLRGDAPSSAADVYALAATLRAVTDVASAPGLAELLASCLAHEPSARPSAAALAERARSLGGPDTHGRS